MLEVTPINLEQANAFVALLHRHHKPVPGAKFALSVADAERKVRGQKKWLSLSACGMKD